MKINRVSTDKHKFLQGLHKVAPDCELLNYIGSLPTNTKPRVAIVGTRKPTAYGREVTERFARELASRGIVVVSGLALGVDAIAHRAALDAGGTTVAILGNGLPNTLPSTNRALGQRILDNGGAIISEYPDHYPPARHTYLARNRIVSGISDAVIITEATLASGTMSTAAHAKRQGIPVFAVPGHITSTSSAGCNALLAKGEAVALTTYMQILKAIKYEDAHASPGQTTLAFSSPQAEAILHACKQGLRNIDELITATDLSASEFTTALTMLELSNGIKRDGDKIYPTRQQ